MTASTWAAGWQRPQGRWRGWRVALPGGCGPVLVQLGATSRGKQRHGTSTAVPRRHGRQPAADAAAEAGPRAGRPGARSPPTPCARSRTRRSWPSSASRKRPGCRRSPTASSAGPTGTSTPGAPDGVTSVNLDSGMNFKGGVGINKALRITGKVGFSGHPMIEHFRFLAANTSRVPKMTIPGPSMLALPRRPGDDEPRHLQGHGRLLCRRGRGLQQGGARLLRRRLPLPATGRHLLRLPVRPRAAGDAARPRR